MPRFLYRHNGGADVQVLAQALAKTTYANALVDTIATELEHSTDDTWHYATVEADSWADAIAIAERDRRLELAKELAN